MRKRVHIKDLSSSWLTRARGLEAYGNLERYLAEGPLEIDVTAVELVSTSFLDELVRRLLESSLLENITFIVDEPAVVEKLGRIASIRQAQIFKRSSRQEARELVSPIKIHHEAQFVGAKILEPDEEATAGPP